MELTIKELKRIILSQKIIGRTLYTIHGTEFRFAENATDTLTAAYMILIWTDIPT